MSNVQDEVVDFVANFVGCKKSEVGLDKSLLHDLGIDGDDATEFIAEYAQKFSVNIDGFKFDEYFGPERPVGLTTVLHGIFAHEVILKKITTQGLIKGVIEGRLNF